ncbi:LysM peptidoglycan-binding domain-containing protein [Flavobacterium sp. ALJ2]|uniref:LysM peptidoglycan-binding domain-containing protein n=1 Tax=Flavobacterium sp. ALJ2 TaxID=2786960 RepID=UPI00189F1012|nr:LysM domain-containing protein [Flavobacterium sp. ALJ2]MBF7090759.1 LysM peptidoglycan-binding domain-containing protein [Flavobacterium sp. ALJ2]
MVQHHIYSVKQDDTLQSIAQEHHMTVEELCHYHNTHCTPLERLENKLSYQRELIIPLEKKKNIKDNSPKKVSFGPNNTLNYFPHNSFYKYGVMITIENGKEKNELKYEASVSCKKQDGDFIFQINRISKININQEEAENIAYILAYKTSQVLYPLTLLIDKDGGWKQVVPPVNYTERWNAIKEEIKKEFEGEMVEEYISKIDKLLQTPETVAHSLSDDLFIRTLFLGYCTSFEKDFTTEKQIRFPIIDNTVEPRYKVIMKVDPLLDQYNLINLEIDGFLDDIRTQADFINNSLFASEESLEQKKANPFGSIKAKAFLHPNKCIPEMIHLECSIDLEETKKISVSIADLSNAEILRVRDNRFSVLESDEDIIEITGFWEKVRSIFN